MKRTLTAMQRVIKSSVNGSKTRIANPSLIRIQIHAQSQMQRILITFSAFSAWNHTFVLDRFFSSIFDRNTFFDLMLLARISSFVLTLSTFVNIYHTVSTFGTFFSTFWIKILSQFLEHFLTFSTLSHIFWTFGKFTHSHTFSHILNLPALSSICRRLLRLNLTWLLGCQLTTSWDWRCRWSR